MIAWVLIAIILFFMIIGLISLIASVFSQDGELFVGSVCFFFFSFIVSLLLIIPWTHQASDLAKVTTQHHMVEVYEKRIDSLENRLNNASYPEKSVVSLDSDSPWATMMNQLSNAETKLADVKAERAKAIRSIEARKNGPMSGVVWIVGDIPQDIRGEL